MESGLSKQATETNLFPSSFFININYETSEKEKSLILEFGQTSKKERTTKLKTIWMLIRPKLEE
jgi:hypothetical protein